MEQAILIIQNRIQQLKYERQISYMGCDYYDGIDERISELESLLDELQNVC